MNEELEWSNIDRNSPIWGGSGCDYEDLRIEVQSYFIGFFKNKLKLKSEDGLIIPIGIEGKDVEVEGGETIKEYTEEEIVEHRRIMSEFDSGVFGNSQLKTEKYFRKLWRDVSEVGFERDDSEQCIDTCKTLIREEVEWWKEREDLKEYGALKVPLLVEHFSWYVIWRLCKYHKLVPHKLHNYASKRQSVLKKDLPQRSKKTSISLNLQTIQFAELCEGFKRIGAVDKATSLSIFKSYLDGSEINTVITPIKFKHSTYVAAFIYLCEEYGLQGDKEYWKWEKFFNISKAYANKQTSAYRTAELSLPPYYQQMKSILKEIGITRPKYK